MFERNVDGVPSRFDLGESLDSLDEFGIEDNIRAFSARFADWPHKILQYTLYVYSVYAIFRDNSMSKMTRATHYLSLKALMFCH